MKKKQKTQNSYQFLPRPDTADTIAARNAAQNINFTDPVNNVFGAMERDIENADFGDEQLPEGIKSRIKYGRMFNLKQAKGAALADATARQEMAKTGNLMNIASMTQSPLVQSGSTQTMSDPMGAITGLLMAGGQTAAAF